MQKYLPPKGPVMFQFVFRNNSSPEFKRLCNVDKDTKLIHVWTKIQISNL